MHWTALQALNLVGKKNKENNLYLYYYIFLLSKYRVAASNLPSEDGLWSILILNCVWELFVWPSLTHASDWTNNWVSVPKRVPPDPYNYFGTSQSEFMVVCKTCTEFSFRQRRVCGSIAGLFMTVSILMLHWEGELHASQGLMCKGTWQNQGLRLGGE